MKKFYPIKLCYFKIELRLIDAYTNIHGQLASDIISLVKAMDPYRFEDLILELLFAMGYGGDRSEAAKATKKSGDGGIDGVINEDRLGLDKIYLQAKRYENTVPIKEIRDFGGAMLAHNAHKGVFITTSDFPASAQEYIDRIDRTLILINGKQLAQLMIEFNIGVSTKETYVLKEVDGDYFEG